MIFIRIGLFHRGSEWEGSNILSFDHIYIYNIYVYIYVCFGCAKELVLNKNVLVFNPGAAPGEP